ncbi:iron-sulfur cluster assembly protein [Arboricoccus pini]|nr:iron-sulfur cluster assembly protein [Arboricoccus pini]
MRSDSDRRLREVWARLALVTDPELDEPVTELGFVDKVEVDEAEAVHVHFRLPTYWCAANFAFLMVDDIRKAASVARATRVHVRLDDHMHGEVINQGLAAGADFKATFGEAEGQDLEALRLVFRKKAFASRQHKLIELLLDLGLDDERLAAMTTSELTGMTDLALPFRHARSRYLKLRPIIGGGAPNAFVTESGLPVTAAHFAAHRSRLRSTDLNLASNGALCRGLLAARYDEDDSLDRDHLGQPTLHHFVRRAACQAAPR